MGGVPDENILELTSQEVSALICACQCVWYHSSYRPSPKLPRPPWDTDGQSAWNKLVQYELAISKTPAPLQPPVRPADGQPQVG